MPVLRPSQRRSLYRAAISVLAILPLTTAANATLPATEIPAGGIVFANQDRLAVEREELTITLDAIDIKYVVRNLNPTTVTLPMAFAMPLIDMAALSGSEVVIPAFEPTNPSNFIGFWTILGTTTVEPDVDVRAFVLGTIDVTRTLTTLGLPLYPFTPDLPETLKRLTPAQRSALADAGTISNTEPPAPLWSLRTTFYWPATLQPSETITVQHHYKPITGSAPWSPELATIAAKKYCMNQTTIEALDKLSTTTKPPSVYWVHYHPGTNAWQKGTAERFKLLVGKPNSTSIVTSCFADLKSASPTELEWSTDDRADDVDIEILIIE